MKHKTIYQLIKHTTSPTNRTDLHTVGSMYFNSLYFQLALEHFTNSLEPDKLYNQRMLFQHYQKLLPTNITHQAIPEEGDNSRLRPQEILVTFATTDNPYLKNFAADVTLPPDLSRPVLVKIVNKYLDPRIN